MRRYRDTKYLLTEDGNVFSEYSSKILKLTPSAGTGYLTWACNGKTTNVHTAIAETYLGERPYKLVTDHIDRNKLNNSVSNLEYITNRENTIKGALCEDRIYDLPTNVRYQKYAPKYKRRGQYYYSRSINGKEKNLKTSVDLDVILRFKLDYERS